MASTPSTTPPPAIQQISGGNVWACEVDDPSSSGSAQYRVVTDGRCWRAKKLTPNSYEEVPHLKRRARAGPCHVYAGRIRCLLRLIAPAAVGLLAAGTAPAIAATPSAGERYDGRSQGGTRVYLRVSRDGQRLSEYAFAVRIRCSDGRSRVLGLLHPGEGPARIDAEGSFGYRSRAERFTLRRRGGRRAPGRIRTSFSGRFDTQDVANGTMETNFRSRRLRCLSGVVPFQVHRDGTSGAPYRNRSMFTGRYVGTGTMRGGRGITGVTLRVFAPGMFVERFRVSWKARCRSGTVIYGTDRFRGLPLGGTHLSQTSRFSERGRQRSRLGRGLVASEVYSLSLRLFHGVDSSFSGPQWLALGTWRLRSVVRRHGRRIDTCRIRGGRFATSWDGTGPRGPGDIPP